ncbi:MAG: phosphopantetheine-binding protein [Sarcina sp.]
MNKLEYKNINLEIRKMVKEKLELSIELELIEDEFLFGTASGFDSTSLLEFILELEEKFDIIIPDEDLTPDNFESISKITNYIIQLRNN